MFNKQFRTRQGFTLVEIMIVVAIIALLAAIAVPNFLRARKRTQATRVLQDLRLLDAAIDQYAIDNGKATGMAVEFADLQPYLKTGTPLYNTGKDLFGNAYGPFSVDTLPSVPASVVSNLADVADTAFWAPYPTDPASADAGSSGGSGSGSDGSGSGSGGTSPTLAAAQSQLQSAQTNFDSIKAQYDAAMAANIGGQPRKTITAQYEAALAALTAAQGAVTAAGG